MLDDAKFSIYGSKNTFLSLLKEAKETQELFARAENSGSEGCYVEVAKWNTKHQAWQKYAFLPILTGDFGESLADKQVAGIMADALNKASKNEHVPFIHNLLTYKD